MRAWLVTGLNAPLGLAALALIAVTGLFASAYDMRVLTVAGVYALLVLGYQFVFGHAGGLSLAQGAFFGLGAYITGILGSQLGWGFAATFPLSIVLPAALAAVVAMPALRLQSHYFALATLAFSQLVLLVAVNWESVTGGANGLPGVPGVELFGWRIGRGAPLLVFVWAWVAVGAVLAWRIMSGLYGRGFALMRAAPVAAGTLGINGAQLRFTGLVLSAAYAGAAGALQAHTVRVVSPEVLGFAIMVTCLAMTVIGGRTRIAGAIAGALLLIHMQEWFRGLEQYYLIAYGVGLLTAIVFAPAGLIDAAERLYARVLPTAAKPVAHRAPPPAEPRPGRAAGAVLRIDDLDKAYGGVQALAGVSLAVDTGEIVGLIGANGSGKTTLANLVSGLDRSDAGRIVLAGHDITGLPAHRIARLGLARSFQTPDLPAEMTLLDAVASARLAIEGAGLVQAVRDTGEAALARARAHSAALLDRFALAEMAHERCAAQPHGVRRRLEVARACATEPRLLVLDEPAAGLTAAEAAALAEQLRRLAADGLALLIIEHDTDFLLPLADRLACLDGGRLIASGATAAVAKDPAVAAAYFGMLPAAAPMSAAK